MMLSVSLRLITLLFIFFVVACTADKGDLKGYVGNEGGSSTDGTTSPSNAVIMLPSTPQMSLAEGASGKMLVLFNKPLPRAVTLNWTIANGEKDFEVVSGVIDAAEDAESVEIDLKVKTDGRYEGEEKFFVQISGDTNIFLSSLMYPVAIQENGSSPLVSVVGPGSPGVKIQQLDENVVAGGTDIFVRQSVAADFPVQVNFSITGTAGAGTDYNLTESGSVTFAPGETVKKIRFNLLNDSVKESPENFILTLTSIPVGSATVDNDNKVHTINIVDDDLGSRFEILGVRGGTDTQADAYLTDGAIPTVVWSNALDEEDYRFTIKNSSNSDVCTSVVVAADVTSKNFDPADCGGYVFLQNEEYSIQAEVKVAGIYYAASNSGVFKFVVDGTPPGNFTILGVFGGSDLEPDQYLAGSMYPSVSWQNASQEIGYKVAIYSRDSGVEVCAPVDVPANVTSVSFETCELVRGNWYKATVTAYDVATNQREATNTNFEFFVTEVASGFLITGLTGGTGDVTADINLNDAGEIGDPYAFTVNWNIAGGIEKYEVTILNSNNTLKCPTVTVTTNTAKISGCRLDLNYNYKARVVGLDINNVQYPATNSPYPFTFKKGLFLSGDVTVPSYYRGIPLTSCAGGAICDAAKPYIVTTAFQEEQIVVGKDAVLTAPSWTTGAAVPGNGVLELTTEVLRIEDNGKIVMDGRGFQGSTGDGHGVDGASIGTGGAHGGNGTRDSLGAQGKAYGSAKNPLTMGSGGGAGGVSQGGKGGGLIKITVNEELAFKAGVISATGASGTAGNAGGGAGGSIHITAKKVSGIGATISVQGGVGAGTGGSGAGGRAALYYQDITHSGGLAGLTVKLMPGGNGGASGTLFTKNTKTTGGDTYGYLTIDLGGTFKQKVGVETPLPLLDPAELPMPTSHLFDAIYSKGEATYIVEATQSYTLQSSASPPTLNYRVVAEGDFLVASGTTLKIGSGGYFEWRKSAPLNTFTDLIVGGGGTLTHSPNTTAKTYSLDVVVNNLILMGTISANGKGFSATNGEPGGIGVGAEGAGYGGQGGYFANRGQRGEANGAIKEPDSLGSASATAPGGGAIKLTVTNELTLTGTISANGSDGCGGGAGGSIWIDTNKLLGSGGSISSQGGGSYTGNCGGGSGGRIAVYYDSTTYTGGVTGINFLVAGGDALVDGAAGTVFHKKTSAPGADDKGHLMVLNAGRDYVEDVVTPLFLVNSDQMNSIVTDARGTILISSQFAGTDYTLPSNQISYRLVAEGDFTLPSGAGHLQIADGGYLEVRRNTPYTFDKLTVSQSGLLTHSTNTDAVKRYFLHFILNDFDLFGKVDVSGRGYPAGVGPGTSATMGFGAGHGGYGGNGGPYVTTVAGAPYQEDKIKTPDDFGSGTITHTSYPLEAKGVAGAGHVRFQVANDFIFSGQILAEGQNGRCNAGNTYCSGGASGGSIYIVTKNIKGVNGTLSANGGNSGPLWGSGAGGRISLVYEDDSQYAEGTVRNLVNYEKIRAFGGTTYTMYTGAAGSIFLRDSDNPANTQGDLIYNNSNNPHPQKVETLAPEVNYDSIKTMNRATLLVPSGKTFALPSNLDYRIAVEGTAVMPANLTIKDKGYLEWRKSTQIALTNLTVESGGMLTHSFNYTTAYNNEDLGTDYRLDLDITNDFTLHGGGALDVSGRGYQAGQGKGPASGTFSAASHGGKSGSGILPYDSYVDPKYHGSGGYDGAGGGVVRIKAGGVTLLNGNILANGVYGGGSGGTIKLETGTLSGVTGSLRTNGTSAYHNIGSSGGRISIIYTTDNYPISYLTMSAYGGDGSLDGAAGTIFYKQSAALYGNLIVNNAGRTYDPNVTTVLPTDQLNSVVVDANSGVEIKAGETVRLPNASVSYRLTVGGTLQLPVTENTLVVENGGILELKKATSFGDKTAGLGEVRNMIVRPLGIVRHSIISNNDSINPNYIINLNLDTLTLQGTLDAAARGPLNGTGYVGGPYGISHGGRGGGTGVVNGASTLELLETKIYGSIKNPTTSGSATGSAYQAGGGVILVDVNRLEMSGTMNANAVVNGNDWYGCSGGSVNVKAGEIISSGGLLTAKGQGAQVGSGGGGRIAVQCTGTGPQCADLAQITLNAEGGSLSSPGGAGTIFVKSFGDTDGHLILNNGTTPYKQGSEVVINETLDFDTITVGSATTGVYVPANIVAKFSSNDIFFPLRLRGDAKFPGATASAIFNPATEHWGDVRVVDGGHIYFNRAQNFNAGFPIVDQPFIYRDFIMEAGSKVSHVANTTDTIHQDQAVYIKTKNHLHIKPDAVIDVSYMGYAAGSGPGKGKSRIGSNAMGPPIIPTNMTVNFDPTYYVGSGGSYGGLGGGLIRYRSGGVPTAGRVAEASATYETNMDPRLPGSGGGTNTSQAKSRGGGLVILHSENLLTLEGQILANGEVGPETNPGGGNIYGLGGGSGGAINILTNELAGAYGKLESRGGNGGAEGNIYGGGGGGGGRISIRRNINSYIGGIDIDLSGGAAFDDTGQLNYFIESPPTSRQGASGTYYEDVP